MAQQVTLIATAANRRKRKCAELRTVCVLGRVEFVQIPGENKLDALGLDRDVMCERKIVMRQTCLGFGIVSVSNACTNLNNARFTGGSIKRQTKEQ